MRSDRGLMFNLRYKGFRMSLLANMLLCVRCTAGAPDEDHHMVCTSSYLLAEDAKRQVYQEMLAFHLWSHVWPISAPEAGQRCWHCSNIRSTHLSARCPVRLHLDSIWSLFEIKRKYTRFVDQDSQNLIHCSHRDARGARITSQFGVYHVKSAFK